MYPYLLLTSWLALSWALPLLAQPVDQERYPFYMQVGGRCFSSLEPAGPYSPELI